MSEDPFTRLIADEAQEIDKKSLVDLLEPFVMLVKKTESIDFLPEFYNLPNELKVQITLAASKVLALAFGTEEKLATKQIIDFDFAPEGSVKSAVKRLSDDKEIKVEHGKYYIPNYRLANLINKVGKYKSKGGS